MSFLVQRKIFIRQFSRIVPRITIAVMEPLELTLYIEIIVSQSAFYVALKKLLKVIQSAVILVVMLYQLLYFDG